MYTYSLSRLAAPASLTPPTATTSYQSGISKSDYAAAKLGNQNKLKYSKIFS